MKIISDWSCGLLLIYLFIVKWLSARRKSNCVKAVEGIQKKRDERRANQEAARLKNERDYDMSDPNWEFLAMIK